MNESDREIVGMLREVGRAPVDAVAAREAVSRVRAARRVEAGSRARRAWRPAAWAAVAAGVLVAALLLVNASSQPATAAERLEAATRASGAYRGWVHQVNRGVGKGAREGFRSELHYNTADGTWVQVERDGREWTATMRRGGTREESVYDSRTNVLTVGEMSDQFAANWSRVVREMPVTMDGGLGAMRKIGLKGELIEQFPAEGKGDWDRYEVTLPPDDPKAAAAQHRTTWPEHASLWVDRKTNLLMKVEVQMPEGDTVVSEMTYGDPPIVDLYSVGVPRDAKVVDRRPAKDAEQLLARLQAKHGQGFGGQARDFVAVVTETSVEKGEMIPAAVTVYGRRGENGVVSVRFLVGEDKTGTGYRTPAPEGWPAPEPKGVLERLARSVPCNGTVCDGTGGAWTVNAWSPADVRVTPLDAQTIERASRRNDLFSVFWPTRQVRGWFGTDVSTEVVRGGEVGEGQVGLRVNQRIWMGRGDEHQRDAFLFVFDERRGDLPVRWTMRQTTDDGEREMMSFATEFLESAQSPGGVWHPTKWRTTIVTHSKGKAIVDEREYVLGVVCGETLPDGWFENPGGRVKK